MAVVEIMALVTAQWGVENTDQDKILLLAAPKVMTVVLIKYIHIARANRVDITLHIFHLAFAGYAVTCLEMVAIVQQRFRPCTHHGVA
ncbi:hypothetical protein NX10_12470 [Pseudomonas fluorescens]|nr:hypothetical protein NX10_12470 [Pseudomonas fluorescens]